MPGACVRKLLLVVLVFSGTSSCIAFSKEKSLSKVKEKTKENTKKNLEDINKKKGRISGRVRPMPGLNAKLDVSGYRSLLYTSWKASGNQQNFKSQNGLYFSKTKLQQEGFLSLRGTLNDGVFVEGELMDRAFDDPTFKLMVRGKNAMTRVGDFDARMGAGPLLSFTKSLRGFLVEGTPNKSIRLEGVFTKQKSQTERQTFQGRNIRGPYQLGNISVVEGSETVKINGVPVSPTVYVFDYFLGELTFRDPVSNADLIEVTYESALFLSNNSSAVQGAAIHFQNPNSPVQGYITALQEGVNALKSNPILADNRSFGTANLTANGLTLNIKRIKRGSILLERIEPGGGFTLLRENTDWEMDYPNGLLTFLIPPTAGTNYQISFEYYNETYIRRILDEIITGQGQSTFTLQKSTVYSGTENVELFQGEAFLQTLLPGKDYVIDEANNSLTVLNPFLQPDQALGRSFRVDYEIVNNGVLAGGQGRRQSMGVGVSVNLGKGFKITADGAQTRGDVSPKTVQVTDQILGIGNGVQTLFNLAFTPVLGSQEIFFDDTFSPQSRKVLGVDYDIEPSVAQGSSSVRFRVAPPPGTVLIINYKYLPPGLAGKRQETGNAFQGGIDGTLADGKLKLNLLLRNKDRAFSPNNELNTLENYFLDGKIEIKPLQPFALSYTRRETENYVDFSSSSRINVTEDVTQLTYSKEKVEEITLRHSQFSRQHPSAIGLLDLDRSTTSALVRIRPFRDRFVLNGQWSSGDQRDGGVLASGARDTDEWEVGAGINGKGSLNGAVRLKHSRFRIGSSPLFPARAAPITFKTTSKEMNLSWNKDIFLFNADYGLQTQDDSRPGRNFSLQDMSIDFSVLPQGAMERFYVAVNRRDYPSDVLGLTRSGSSIASLTWLLGNRLALNPAFTRSTYTQNNLSLNTSSLNETTTYGATLDFRRTGKTGLGAQLVINTGDRNSETSTSTGPRSVRNGNTSQHLFKLDYILERYSMAIALEDNNDRDNTGTKTRTLNRFIDQNVMLNRRITLRGLYNKQETKAVTKSDRDRYLLELRTRAGKNYDFFFSMEWQKTGSAAVANDYDGTIAKAELRARF